MAFNIDKMVSEGLKSGVAKTAHYEVVILPPPIMLSKGNNWTSEARDLTYRADSVEIPGRTTLTIDHKFSNMGPINKIPYSQIYPDVTITFMLSDDFREKMFFDEWQSKMLDTSPSGTDQMFNVKYFDEYKSTIIIKQFDAVSYLRSEVTLHEAYPIIMNGVQMGWQNDEIARVSVQMALRYYTTKYYQPPQRIDGPEEKSEVPQLRPKINQEVTSKERIKPPFNVF